MIRRSSAQNRPHGARMAVPGVKNPETDRREYARYRRRPDLARVFVKRRKGSK